MGQPFALAHLNTSRWPFRSDFPHVDSSQSTPTFLKYTTESRWPPHAAIPIVFAFNISFKTYPDSWAHCSGSRFPLLAALCNTFHGSIPSSMHSCVQDTDVDTFLNGNHWTINSELCQLSIRHQMQLLHTCIWSSKRGYAMKLEMKNNLFQFPTRRRQLAWK